MNGHGGYRPGSGRKPSLLTIQRKAIIAKACDDASYALQFFVQILKDDSMSVEMRLAAGKEVMDRVWGKPAQVTRVAGQEEFKEHLARIAEASRGASQVEQSAIGPEGPGQAGELSGGGVCAAPEASPDP